MTATAKSKQRALRSPPRTQIAKIVNGRVAVLCVSCSAQEAYRMDASLWGASLSLPFVCAAVVLGLAEECEDFVELVVFELLQ